MPSSRLYSGFHRLFDRSGLFGVNPSVRVCNRSDLWLFCAIIDHFWRQSDHTLLQLESLRLVHPSIAPSSGSLKRETRNG
jgi:hypothetical protein